MTNSPEPSARSRTERRVFVYGTLMPGQVRWRFLRPFAASWEPATAPGLLWDTGRGYPAATFAGGGGVIPGVTVVLEVETAEAAIRVLDGIEGEGSLYGRVPVMTSRGPALSYEWLGATDGFRPLPGGWAVA
ncbi:MAG: gamma-glutamylcyclotransferase family protein [Acidimicrobiia bacterium]